MAHHANDGTASRILRGLLRERGYHPDPRPELATATTQDAKCAVGEHDEVTTEPGRVSYLGIRRLAVGTRYCRRCFTILAEGSGPMP